jgi:cytochrome d ubiquinol oxidase subunit I
VAAAFGLAAALSVVVLGDESGYSASHTQKMKLAAIEAMWETEPRPAPFTAIRLSRPGGARDPLRGRHPLGDGPDRHAVADRGNPRHQRSGRIRAGPRGIIAYDALMTIREQRDADPARGARDLRGAFGDLGFAFC